MTMAVSKIHGISFVAEMGDRSFLCRWEGAFPVSAKATLDNY